MKLPFTQADIDAGSLDRTRGQDRCAACPLAHMFTRLVGKLCEIDGTYIYVGSVKVPLTAVMRKTVGIADEHESQLVPRIFNFPNNRWAQLIGGDA